MVELIKLNKAFWICLSAAVGLMIAGFFAPPLGVIDNSVLYAIAVLFGFACLAQLPLIMKGRSLEIKHGETSVTIGDDD